MSAPTPLHPCPAHGGSGTHAGAAHSGDALAEHEGHVMPAAVEAAATSDIAPSDADTPPRCECIGGCCVASPVTLATSAITPVEPVLLARQPHAVRAPESAPSRGIAHRLPFANGPPALVS